MRYLSAGTLFAVTRYALPLFSKRPMTRHGFAKSILTLLCAVAVLAQAPKPDSDPRIPEAARLIQQGSLNQAVNILDSVVSARPDDAAAHLLLGSALSMVPRRNEAVEALLRALELRPDHAPSHAAAGTALARLGEQDAALEVFERAITLDSELGDAHLNLALILAGKKELDSATRHMARAIELETDSDQQARLRFLNGKLYTERNRLEEAAREFEHSIELDPQRGEAYLALGVTWKRLLREAEAYPLLEKAVALAPKDAMALYQLALELLRRGNSQSAADHLLKAHELKPEEQSIVYNLTRALHKAGRKDEYARYRIKLTRMIEAADKARENELDTARLHGDAVRLEESGDYAAALDKYRTVLEFEPLNAVARRNMALVLCRLNRWEEGIEELQAILRDDPDDADTARALNIALDQAPQLNGGPNSGTQ